MNQKGLAQLLILGLIAATLIAGLSFGYVKYFKNENENTNSVANKNENTNVNSTTSWQVYTSDSYNFTLKYPSDYKISESEGGIIVTPPSGTHNRVMTVAVIDMSLNNYIEYLKNDHIDPKPEANANYVISDGTPYLDEEETIGDITWRKLGFGTAIGINDIYWLVEKDGMTHSINTGQTSNFETSQLIVKSFQFTSTDETADWETYTNELMGFSFKYPPGTQVNHYDNIVSISMDRVVSLSNPNKDADPYPAGVGPGPIGITVYSYQDDLAAYAEQGVGHTLEAEEAEVAGVSGYRVNGVLDSSSNWVVGSEYAETDHYYINYNAATWGFEFDANLAFADQTPSHEDFLNILSTFKFTE